MKESKEQQKRVHSEFTEISVVCSVRKSPHVMTDFYLQPSQH